jgi:hypothetical protein
MPTLINDGFLNVKLGLHVPLASSVVEESDLGRGLPKPWHEFLWDWAQAHGWLGDDPCEKCFGPSSLWKYLTLSGLSRGLFIDPSLVTSTGAPRSIVVYTKKEP